jgi:dTDP-4-dehydrorhamnose reductase
MRFLLLGGAGQVGTEIRALAASSAVEVFAPERSAFDLTDPAAITRIVGAGPWSAAINAAAYTDVDRAEGEEAVAFAVNADAASRLADATARHAIPLIHISTDYVFDGRKNVPYVEQDKVGPLNVYGRSKLAGERGVCAANPRHFVLRTSWVYSPYGKNFVKTVLHLADERDQLTIVADQRGCPTAACDIATACLTIAMRCAIGPDRVPYGVYHYAGAGEASWYEFATAIIDLAGDRLAKAPEIVPIRTIDYPTPAVRPADTRLNCAAIERQFGVKLRAWRQPLADTIDRLLTNKGIS